MASAAQSFSYAQAARRQSPPHSASNTTKAESDTSEVHTKLEQANGSAVDVASNSNSSESHNRPNGFEDASQRADKSHERSKDELPHNDDVVEANSIASSSVKANGHVNGSSVAIDAKEEDATVTPATNELDSTWEKVSERSNSDGKISEKAESDGDDAKLTSWEQVPQPAPLKEAPPPSFNIWQQRAADQKSKTKASRPTQKAENGLVTSQSGMFENSETVKPDGKKRSANGRLDDKGYSDDARSGESKGRAHDDKAVARGTKSFGSMKSVAAPPLASDTTSWPTPNLAKEDEKKKSQDRTEKSELEKTPNKPHPKKEWQKIDFTPSAVFSTPLPTAGRRGGGRLRGSREGGGRGGHAVNGSVSGERTPSGAVTSPGAAAPSSTERTRGDMGPPRSGPLPHRNKRASSAGPPSSRDQRRNGDGAADESGQKSFNRHNALENRRTSSATQPDNARQGSPSGRKPHDYQREERSQSVYSNRREGAPRSHDHPRELGSAPSGREGRSDRGGRGGYRSRGGHNGYSGHVNGQGASNGYGNPGNASGYPSKSHSYSEQRYASQPPTPSFGAPRDQKHFRTGSRAQSMSNQTYGGRHPSHGTLPGQHGLAPLQTEAANNYYTHPGAMSAVPFDAVLEQAKLGEMIQFQMEYYLSLSNLVKDTHLRSYMDSQGFINLKVILDFNRIKSLTNDIELVRAACWRSHSIEFQSGPDGIDRVRPMRGWQQWILPMNERKVEAQNDGPAQLQAPYLPFGTSYGHHPMGGMGPPGPMNAGSFGQSHYTSEPGSMNGNHVNQSEPGHGSVTQTPLSAAVPDFTPMSAWPPQMMSAGNDPHESTFPDDQVNNLTIVMKKEQSEVPSLKPPPAEARTFSNGSFDPHNAADDVSGPKLSDHPDGVSTNGDQAPESHSHGPFIGSQPLINLGNSNRQSFEHPTPPVLWVKDCDVPLEGLPANLVAESYTTFRHKTLKQHQDLSQTRPNHDLDVLFQFWAHFLIRNFNASMYGEFQRLALEDDNSGVSTTGLENIVTFYDASILGEKPVSDFVVEGYVDLARNDFETERQERPAFQRLRSSLRNGALSLKNRIKIDKLLSNSLKAELEG